MCGTACRLTRVQRKREREGRRSWEAWREEHEQNLTAGEGEIPGVDLEDKDEKQCALALPPSRGPCKTEVTQLTTEPGQPPRFPPRRPTKRYTEDPNAFLERRMCVCLELSEGTGRNNTRITRSRTRTACSPKGRPVHVPFRQPRQVDTVRAPLPEVPRG